MARHNQTLYDEVHNQQGIRIVLIGITGEGKSSLGNVLLGHLHNEGPFSVSSTVDSETTELESIEGGFMGDPGKPIQVVDTPGHNDSEGRDEKFRKKMVDGLKNFGFAHVFLWVRNAERPRIDGAEKQYLEILQRVFGGTFMDNLMIVFSHWGHSKSDAKKRERTGVTFESLKRQFWNELKKGHGGGGENRIPMFTLDALHDYEDEMEINAFKEESERIWQAAQRFKQFPTIGLQMVKDMMAELQDKVTNLSSELEHSREQMKQQIKILKEMEERSKIQWFDWLPLGRPIAEGLAVLGQTLPVLREDLADGIQQVADIARTFLTPPH